jgi:hypothetical protein
VGDDDNNWNAGCELDNSRFKEIDLRESFKQRNRSEFQYVKGILY